MLFTQRGHWLLNLSFIVRKLNWIINRKNRNFILASILINANSHAVVLRNNVIHLKQQSCCFMICFSCLPNDHSSSATTPSSSVPKLLAFLLKLFKTNHGFSAMSSFDSFSRKLVSQLLILLPD